MTKADSGSASCQMPIIDSPDLKRCIEEDTFIGLEKEIIAYNR